MPLALQFLQAHVRPILGPLTLSATVCRHLRDHLAHKKAEREVAFDAEKGVEDTAAQATGRGSAETAPLQEESAATAAAPVGSEPEPELEPKPS
jgi:hypothetical protein